jgi:hypothetical protein
MQLKTKRDVPTENSLIPILNDERINLLTTESPLDVDLSESENDLCGTQIAVQNLFALWQSFVDFKETMIQHYSAATATSEEPKN